MTTIGALLIMAVVSILAAIAGFSAGVVCTHYNQKVRNEEAGRKILQDWMKGKPVQPEVETRVH